MLKLVMLFFTGVACIQLIRPLGWPGLKTRQDAWKLAVAGMVVGFILVAVTAGLKSNVG